MRATARFYHYVRARTSPIGRIAFNQYGWTAANRAVSKTVVRAGLLQVPAQSQIQRGRREQIEVEPTDPQLVALAQQVNLLDGLVRASQLAWIGADDRAEPARGLGPMPNDLALEPG